MTIIDIEKVLKQSILKGAWVFVNELINAD